MWLTYLNTKAKPSGGALTYTTITNYRFAAHAAHTDFGLPSPFADNKLVQLLMQSIRRSRAAAGEVSLERLPITRAVLLRITPLLNLQCHDDALLAAAIWVATTALLRPGELAIEQPNNTSRMLSINSLKTTADGSYLHLRESKTDTWRTGTDVKIRSQRACELLTAYLQLRPNARGDDALFQWSNGKPLLHTELTGLTEKLLAAANVPLVLPDGSPCRGVSFRKGGASDLANTGVTDKAIQVIGRWKSFCSLRYIHPSNALLDAAASAAERQAHTNTLTM